MGEVPYRLSVTVLESVVVTASIHLGRCWVLGLAGITERESTDSALRSIEASNRTSPAMTALGRTGCVARKREAADRFGSYVMFCGMVANPIFPQAPDAALPTTVVAPTIE